MPARDAVLKPKRGGINAEAASTVSTAVVDVDLEPLKHHWWGLSCEARLKALRFTNHGLVQRAWTIKEALYNSELACYQCGIVSQHDQAGQPLVSNGLRHFAFEWPAKPELCSARTAGEQGELATVRDPTPCKPEALVATREFVEGVDVFAYIEQQLGGFLVRGVPFLHRKDLTSTFDSPPHSWTEYERQILKLVEVALFQVQNEACLTSVAPAVLSTDAGVIKHGTGAEVEAAEAAASLLDEEDALSSAAERRAKKKARKKAAAATRKQLATPVRSPEALDVVEEDAASEAALDDDVAPGSAATSSVALETAETLEAAAQKFVALEDGEWKLWRRPRLCDMEASAGGGSSPSTCCPSTQFHHSRNTSTGSSVFTVAQSPPPISASPMSLAAVPAKVLEGNSPAPVQTSFQAPFPSRWAAAWSWNGLKGDSAKWSCVEDRGDGYANGVSVRHTFLHVSDLAIEEGKAPRRRARSLGDASWPVAE
jgi:hypothetical protein